MLRRKEPPARLADVLWDRTAAAITMALLSAPACILLVLGLMFGAHGLVFMAPWKAMAWGIGGCAAIGFLFPRGCFDVLGFLWELLFSLGR